jgi:predicted transcriptional regulator
MQATLTFRLPAEHKRQLQRLAAGLGKTESELVRQMIERGLAVESIAKRLARFKGCLSEAPSEADAFSRAIRQRNWRRR